MLFFSGDYNYTLPEFVENVKESMEEEGCDESCLNDNLTEDAETFEEVAKLCGCPTYMVRYEKA